MWTPFGNLRTTVSLNNMKEHVDCADLKEGDDVGKRVTHHVVTGEHDAILISSTFTVGKFHMIQFNLLFTVCFFLSSEQDMDEWIKVKMHFYLAFSATPTYKLWLQSCHLGFLKQILSPGNSGSHR